MNELLTEIEPWLEKGEPTALATVVQTWGAAPRGVGAKMAFTADGRFTGSVSGGCVEVALMDAGREVLRSGRPRLLRFGVTDERAWSVGLSCGGTIDVFVEPLDARARAVLEALRDGAPPMASVTVIAGADESIGRKMVVGPGNACTGSLGDKLDAAARDAARNAQRAGQPRRVALGGGTISAPTEAFIDVIVASPTLVIVGGVHIAIALATIAKVVGYRTVLIDPRHAFGSSARFPHVDRLIQAWPEEALHELDLEETTAIVMLTHDPKIDEPALAIALRSPAYYVGALGSRQTHAKRRQRLLAAGLSETEVERVHAPVGLDIGARNPEEIALSVMAEVVASRPRITQPRHERAKGGPEAQADDPSSGKGIARS